MAEDVVIRISARNLSKAAFKDALRDVAGLEQGTKNTERATAGFGLTVGRLAGALGLATLGIQGLRAGYQFAKDSAIGLNAQLEQSELQFTTLIGDADEARAHVRELFEFAKRTPFETPGIIQASKFLQQFGGEALNSQDNLTLLGDAAAATGAPFQDLAFWTGRLFAQLQAGKPFGEAAQRLTELAVLTPQARAEMEEMQKSGASAREIFASFQEQLGSFTGAMELQADTWTGLTSTFWENVSLFIADRSVGAFELLKDTIRGVNSVFEEINLAGDDPGAVRIERLREQLESLSRALEATKNENNEYNEALLREAVAIQASLTEHTNKRFALEQEREALVAAEEAERAKAAAEEEAVRQSIAGAKQQAEILEELRKQEDLLTETKSLRLSFDEQLAAAGRQLFQVEQDTLPLTVGLGDAFKDLVQPVREAELAIRSAHDILAEFAEQLGQEAPPTFFETLTSGIRQELSELDLGNLIVGAFQGGGNISATIGAGLGDAIGTAIGDSVRQNLGGSLGSAIGSFGGPLGALAGGFLGDAIGALFSIGGPSEAELQARDLVKAFEDELIAGLNESQAAEAAGERWKQVVISVRDTFVEAGLTAEEGVAAVQRLWDAIQDGGPDAVASAIADIERVREAAEDAAARETEAVTAVWDALREGGPDAVSSAIAELERLAGSAELSLEERGQAAVQALWDAVESGSEEAIAAAILELERIQTEIEETAATAATDFDAMEKAAEKYGISLHALGPEFKKARIHEEADQILQDFRLLVDGGGNVEGVLRGMGDEVSTFVTRAKKFGTSVPEDMRPMLEDMLEMGVLTDENGVKLEDLEGIKFATGVEGELDKISTTLEGVASLFEDFLTRLANIPDAEARVRVRVDDSELRELGGDEGSVRFEGFRTGTDFRDFGPSGTLVALHGEEAVIPRSQTPSLAADIAARIGSGGGGGTTQNFFILNASDLDQHRDKLSAETIRELQRLLRGGEFVLPVGSIGERV